MKVFHSLTAAAVCCCLLLGNAGCAAEDSGGMLQSLPQCSPEKQLIVYTSQPDDVCLSIVREFEERTGIWVQIETGGSQELFSRIAEESGAPEADVMFGGGIDSLQAFRDYFVSCRSDQIENIQSEYIDADGHWVGFSVLPAVIVYNTKLVGRRDIPISWTDLSDPKWLGRIAFGNPEVVGSCYTVLSMTMQRYGENYVREFIRNLGGSCLQSTEEITQAVVNGSCAIGITTESSARQAISKGADLAYLYPEGGTSAIPDGVAIVRGAPHVENARLFIDFLLGRDVQVYLANELDRRPIRNDIVLYGLPRLETIPLIDYDVEQAASQQEHVLELWRTEFSASEVPDL